MFCQYCGSQVASDTQFCPTCGRSQTPGEAAAPPAAWVAPAGVKSHTGAWIGEGWRLVKADLGMFALLGLMFIALNGLVPVILQGPLTAGMHIYCIKKLLGRPVDFNDFFKGFNYFVPALVATLVISVFVFAGSLLCIIPGLVVAAMFKFTHLFIVDKRMDFWPAMQASHAVVKNDYFGFTLFLIMLALVNLLGVLCCIVGVFVTLPLTFAAITAAYRDSVGFDPRTAETI